MKNRNPNLFLRIFGRNNTMKVLDYLLDQPVDVTVLDICRGTKLSRKTVDEILSNLLEESIIEKTRTIGKAQLFKIKKDDPVSQKLLELNQTVVERYEGLNSVMN